MTSLRLVQWERLPAEAWKVMFGLEHVATIQIDPDGEPAITMYWPPRVRLRRDDLVWLIERVDRCRVPAEGRTA